MYYGNQLKLRSDPLPVSIDLCQFFIDQKYINGLGCLELLMRNFNILYLTLGIPHFSSLSPIEGVSEAMPQIIKEGVFFDPMLLLTMFR